jgi:hypothetical protein
MNQKEFMGRTKAALAQAKDGGTPVIDISSGKQPMMIGKDANNAEIWINMPPPEVTGLYNGEEIHTIAGSETLLLYRRKAEAEGLVLEDILPPELVQKPKQRRPVRPEPVVYEQDDTEDTEEATSTGLASTLEDMFLKKGE